MAVASQREGKGRCVVAVIGDGAMSAGMAFEASEQCGRHEHQFTGDSE